MKCRRLSHPCGWIFEDRGAHFRLWSPRCVPACREASFGGGGSQPGGGPGPPAPIPDTPRGLIVSAVDGGYALSLDPLLGGPQGAFYVTARPIENPRTIVIPAAAIPTPNNPNPPAPTQPTVLALWNERQEDGELVAYRAFRQGGRAGADGDWRGGDADQDGVFDAGFVCIGEIDYRAMLQFAEFDPLGLPGQQGRPGIGPPTDFPQGLRASDVPGSGGADGGGSHLYLVQFLTQPLPEYYAAVHLLGATTRSFIADSTHIVQMNDRVAAQVAALPFVRWVGPFHPAYRAAREVLEPVFGWHRPAETPDPRPYVIQVFERGLGQKSLVADRIEGAGGSIAELFPEGFLLTAVLTPAQLAAVLCMDEVLWISPWAPPEIATDLARTFSGADYLDTPPRAFRGQGVRGEVFDSDVLQSHEAFFSPNPPGHRIVFHGTERPAMIGDPCQDWTSAASPRHGTSTFGIVFGNSATFRGMLPEGAGIFSSYQRLFDNCPGYGETCSSCPICGCPPLDCCDCNRGEECVSREAHTAELVDPAGPYQAVFQSNSFARSGHSLNYDDISMDLDDIAFRYDLLICQAQGNQGAVGSGTNSFREAWAKNVLSVGGVKHRNTLTTSDDCWCPQEPCLPPCADCVDPAYPPPPALPRCASWPNPVCPATGYNNGASTGPSGDTTRVKPDLVHFYDAVKAPGPDCEHSGPWGNSEYLHWFGGTSAATPIVAGLAGLFYQMWHEGVFTGYGASGATVFASRPHATTAKAMLINTALQYPLPTSTDLTRMRQGWGVPNLQTMYDLRSSYFIVDETTDLQTVGDVATYTVVAGTSPLKATLVYADPPGTPGSNVHRVNDLSLKLTSPSGVVYWGNYKLLTTANWSQSGGSRDSHNTVENVFIQSPPEAGVWTIRVYVDALNEIIDGNPETPMDNDPMTPDSDIDFALVVSGVVPAFSVDPDWDGDGHVDAKDFAAFLNDFIAGKADVDHDGLTRAEDLYAFIDLFLASPEQSAGRRHAERALR
jgi:serine protease AprX